MEVTTTLISSLLAVNIIDIAVRELRIRRDAKETIKAIEKITLSNEDCIKRVKFCEKEFNEMTSLMLSNKIHYDTITDDTTSRIDLMQVRLNKENMSLESQIKEMEKHWSVQIRTLDNELQSTIKGIDKIKKESQFRVVPSSELFLIENLQRQVQDLQERFNIVYEKDSVDIATLNKRERPRKESTKDANFNRVPAEELLNDATPIMDWANEKLHEDEPNHVEEPNEEPNEEPIEEPNEEPIETEKERSQVAMQEALEHISNTYKISLSQAKVVLRFILEKAKAKEEEKTKSQVEQQSNQEQQSKRRGRPRKETQQVLEDAQSTETTSEVKTTATTPPTKRNQKKSLFTTKEVHDEIHRKLKVKWFTLLRKYGEEHYDKQYTKAYKRLYYYKFEAKNSPKETNFKQLTTNENNTTNYESIF
jgi:hypothetical protein